MPSIVDFTEVRKLLGPVGCRRLLSHEVYYHLYNIFPCLDLFWPLVQGSHVVGSRFRSGGQRQRSLVQYSSGHWVSD